MALLDFIPTGNVLLWLVGGALAGSLVFGSVQTVRLAKARVALADEQRNLATEQRDRATDVARAAQAAREQSERFRAKEAEWGESQRKAVDEAERKTAQARNDAVLADAARGRLQQRVAELAAAARRAAANPAAPGASAPAEDAAGVLAELQQRADERAGILARVADERGAAGELCERSYDALTAP